MCEDLYAQCTYEAESDTNFPELTVAQTLDVAAKARTPHKVGPRLTSESKAKQRKDAILSSLGLTQSCDTKVGNDFVRGISGGERKRLSIAEVLVGGSIVQCWDNSTRGLDSGNAQNFLSTLRSLVNQKGSVAFVALYQASQKMYDVFDLVILLYEGRQIFFGSTSTAKAYFTRLGFVSPKGLPTGDFLTSLTNPAERVVRDGFESKVPRTVDDFTRRWNESEECALLINE